jgi:hypothetical protein
MKLPKTVLGKRIAEVAKMLGKTVKTFEVFPKSGTFGAIGKAEDRVKELGYSKGSMCRDEPIALIKGDCYIAKWYNISVDEWPRIEGVLLSNDMREGSVALVIFE